MYKFEYRNRNPDYVRNASYTFIGLYKEINGRYPTDAVFNRFMITLGRKAMSELGCDIGLPHCWSSRGDVLVRSEFPYVRWNYQDDGTVTVSFDGENTDVGRNDIDDFIGTYASAFAHSECQSDCVFSEAPYSFVTEYRYFIDVLRSSELTTQDARQQISDSFRDAMSSFPADLRFLDDRKETFMLIFEESLKRGAPVGELSSMAEHFWYYFSRYLKLVCNENVSTAVLGQWETGLDMANGRFERIMQDCAYDLCSDSDDLRIKQILSERERKNREMDAIMDELFG